MICFATSALFLVLLMDALVLAEHDHVDGDNVDDNTALPLRRDDAGGPPR